MRQASSHKPLCHCACSLAITVFQSHWQGPNSKGRAVIHSDELPPESHTNYRPSHRLITARAPGPPMSAGVAGYNPGPGPLKFRVELPPSASPTASGMQLPAAHRDRPPSTLTEVSYRAPARGRAASGTPDSELPVKKNEPHAGGPIDRPKWQPRKGRPVINMPEAPGRPGDGSLTPAGTPA